MTVHAPSAEPAVSAGDAFPAAFAERQHATVQAIRAHHAQLGRTMADHALTVQRSIEQLASPSARQATLVTFCADELLPHATAEEETLYGAAAELPATRLLVRAMTREHVILGDLVGTLTAARTPGEVLGTAAALNAIFQAHLEKENDVLLPALVEAGVDLDALLAGMHELIGGSHDHSHAHAGGPAAESGTGGGGCGGQCGCGGHDQAGYDETATADVVDGELDVRALAPAQRHEQIFATFRALSASTAFVLINDHDPKPLYYQFAAEHPGEFTWDYLEEGPRVWRVRIGRP